MPAAERPLLAATFVAFDYFPAMGIPLREGRLFRDDELEDDGYGRRVLLNESAARLLFPGRTPLGGRFTVGSNPDRELEVIGVVKDTRDVRLEQPQPRFYWQYAFGGAQVVIRARMSAPVLVPWVREAVRRTDGRVRVASARALSEIVASTVAERRFLMILVSRYPLVALGVASVGLFGVVSYQVAQRRNEFGVRLALGASPGALQRLVLVQAGKRVGLGLAIGTGVSLVTHRLLASQVFGLATYEPALLGVAVGIVSLGGAGRRFRTGAAGGEVDPLEALRCE